MPENKEMNTKMLAEPTSVKSKDFRRRILLRTGALLSLRARWSSSSLQMPKIWIGTRMQHFDVSMISRNTIQVPISTTFQRTPGRLSWLAVLLGWLLKKGPEFLPP